MKRKILWWINISIFLILFSFLFFYLTKGEYSATRICSYIFIVLSYICGPILYFTTSSRDAAYEVYAYPKLLITLLFFIASFSVGIIFMILNNESPIIPLLAEGTIIAIFVVAITFILISEDASIKDNLKSKANSKFRDECVSTCELIWRGISPQDTRNLRRFSKIQNVVKTLRSAAGDDLGEIDSEIREILKSVGGVVAAGGEIPEEKTVRLVALCGERNYRANLNYNSQ